MMRKNRHVVIDRDYTVVIRYPECIIHKLIPRGTTGRFLKYEGDYAWVDWMGDVYALHAVPVDMVLDLGLFLPEPVKFHISN